MQNGNTRKCRICGKHAQPASTMVVSNGYALESCVDCQTVMVGEPPEDEGFKGIYDQLFSDGGGAYENHRASFEKMKAGGMPRIRFRSRLLKSVEAMCEGRRLIEIGGGTGSFGMLASSRGWRYTDFDISGVAVDFARKLSLDAHVFRAGDAPPLAPQSADVIAMWEVIEHVWNVNQYLQAIRDALRPGGVFLFSTPNYARRAYQASIGNGTSGSSPPVHINFFTKESLEKSLSACGFTSVRIVRQRLHKPAPTLHSIVDNLRIALSLDESKTLYGVACKS
jgi:SAM-dependent methyltransferase